jgi:hypothetical protein
MEVQPAERVEWVVRVVPGEEGVKQGVPDL